MITGGARTAGRERALTMTKETSIELFSGELNYGCHYQSRAKASSGDEHPAGNAARLTDRFDPLLMERMV